MSHAENRPLNEYGDLHSQHHIDRQRLMEEQEAQRLVEEEPPKMVVTDGPGNLYRVKWTHGDNDLPFEVHGEWNHKGKATEAIRGAEARLRRQDAADVLAKAQAAEKEAMEAEVKAEEERLIAESEAARLAAEQPDEQFDVIPESEDELHARADAEAKASKPAPKKTTKRTTK